MPRSQTFHASRKPLQDHPVPPQHASTSGPLPFCNPTRAHFRFPAGPDHIERIWRSRDNRKGRHALKIHRRPPDKQYPRPTAYPTSILHGLSRMFTTFPYWDISFWVAIIFTAGSVIWVLNAFFVWLPREDPRTEFPGEVRTGGGVAAFIGATVFEPGSVLLVLEASDLDTCVHPHADRWSFLPLSDRGKDVSRRRGRWPPTVAELRAHYVYELGFWASTVQLVGATVFWIAGFTGLPGIADRLVQRVENGVYWVPQIVGGSCFVWSGQLFMLETQPKWHIPAIRLLG
ncbi:hypothetical protein BDV59DRAFT_205954 [Aspergillus ambiguus]|uniref:uncharacterized protein n=1 Tax=Aspergillus ambiguus TaxID=176160 RepID=UPI003CCE4091